MRLSSLKCNEFGLTKGNLNDVSPNLHEQKYVDTSSFATKIVYLAVQPQVFSFLLQSTFRPLCAAVMAEFQPVHVSHL